ncbi:uncharacterized protein [Rutidosis leptorrhynchoides]|uniref:uncharacterized protein n=1 Tax=Rutidosis leptorrhynchoides TaxID=125765 RepID=UPI003A98D686
MGDNDDIVMIMAEEFASAVAHAPPRLKYTHVWCFLDVPKGNVLRLPKELLEKAPELKKGNSYQCVDIDDRVHTWGLLEEKNRKKPQLVCFFWLEEICSKSLNLRGMTFTTSIDSMCLGCLGMEAEDRGFQVYVYGHVYTCLWGHVYRKLTSVNVLRGLYDKLDVLGYLDVCLMTVESQKLFTIPSLVNFFAFSLFGNFRYEEFSKKEKNLVNSNVVGGVVLESVGPSDVQVVSDKQSKKRASLRKAHASASGSSHVSVSFSLHAQLTPIYTIFASFDVSGVSPLYRDSGDCTSVCMQCGALFWRAEHVKSYFWDKQLHYHRCCENGRVYLPRYEDPPGEFKRLLETPAFLDNVRAYNQMFSMMSFCARIDENINDGRSPYVFKISGQIYHWLGSMCPEQGSPPRFLQLYIYDTDHEVENRMGHFRGRDSGRLSEVVVTQLVKLLDSNNALVKLFRTARDKCAGSEVPTFKVCLYSLTGLSQHALPTSDAIGAIVFYSVPQSISDYDVIIEPQSQLPRRVNKLHPLYMSLQFPLMFFFGEPSFHPDLKLCAASGSQGARYVVTAYCSIELDQMDYIRNKQNDIRAEYLSGLYDAIDRGDKTGSDVSSMTILPASFTGGPRYMYSHYLDALAISRIFRKPTFFVTFTCNAKWPEIARYLKPFPHLSPSDRADIVARVFHMKKRGLPHCHTLVWVHSSVSAAIRDNLDDYISAELHDLRIDYPSYAVISATMMHGPCGLANKWASCNQIFHVQKTSQRNTLTRRTLMTTVVLTIAGVILAHINVKCCGTTSLIKYMFKYISKGTDRVAVCIAKPIRSDSHQSQQQTQPVDEIKNFIDALFICPHEACWRIFNFPIHHRETAVQILAFHLENMQLVKFPGKQPLRTIVENAEAKKTTLTEWLNYNASSVSGSHLTYLDFPTEFVWYESKKTELLGDDREWLAVLEEASVSATSSQLRSLFAHILSYCTVTNPLALWENHWKLMGDDIPLRAAANLNMPHLHINTNDLHNFVLYEVEIILNQCSKSIFDFALPSLPVDLLEDLANHLIMEDRNYDRAVLNTERLELERQMNSKQKQIYDLITSASLNECTEHTKGGKSAILGACITTSHLWQRFNVFILAENMRLLRPGLTPSMRVKNAEFSKWLLRVGNGEIGLPDKEDPLNSHWVQIPDQFCIPDDENGLANLISFIYPCESLQNPSAVDLQQKAIVCPKNDAADMINGLIVNMVDGPVRIYCSYDTATLHGNDGGEAELLYPAEYLNTLNYPGLSPHELHLKKGVTAILLRNINIAGGLCNGTRMIITQMLAKSVEAEIITGTRVGEKVFFPRMSLIHKEPMLPFILKRQKLPLKISYAMTINKSQGQPLNQIGVYLLKPLFGHGQLYVALSRATSPGGLKLLIKKHEDHGPNVTKNIVYTYCLSAITDLEAAPPARFAC